jgi:hypothetical protein
MEKTIKIARMRNMPYIFNYITNGGIKRWEWVGSRGDKVDIKELPEDAVQYLLMNTTCFTKGDLAVIEDKPEAKEIVENIDDIDQYKNNVHTHEQIVKLLNGNYKALEKALNSITSIAEKTFVIDVAKEIKLDSNAKLKLLAKWMNVEQDLLFDDDSEEKSE